ncbi:hypothetical protein GCM10023143_11410 [Compostibacter hankyongensis]|uniref:Collagen-like protein n=1 Tax=Compostibacter hankyongensis TaxID=1007089 RepID=A0ABP8FKE7_9BACT
MLTFLFSCKKGDIGPQGPQGEQGIKGADGNTVLSGKGAPSASVGDVGDFYIDLNADALYGPKTGSGWGSAINLRGDKGDKGSTGATGAAGKNGSAILSGNGAPALSLGTTGDYYLDKTNSLFYGPKTSGSWGTPVSLKGLKGDKGDRGTANVIYSDWFIPNSYTKDTVFGIWGFSYTKPVSQLTQAVIDKGSVLVYAKLLGYNSAIWPGSQVAQLPIQLTYVQGATTMTDTWSALITPGNIKIRFIDDHNIYTAIATTHQFRYVIIPGGVKATSTINLKDYNAVKAAFRLAD